MKNADKTKNLIIAMCTIAYFTSYFSRKTFAVIMANMIELDVADKDVCGLVCTVLFVFYGFGQLISGYMGDKLPPKYLMLAGLITTGVCNLLIPLVPNQHLMIPVWAINGFAQALLWPPIVRILSENLTHERYVTANLVVTCGAHASTIILYLYAPFCIRFMSWKSVFFTATIISLVAGIIFIVVMNLVVRKSDITAGAKSTPKNAEKTSILKAFRESGAIYIIISIIAMGFLRDGVEGWIPTLYSEAFNKNSEESILISVIIPIFSIVSLFIIRLLHKRPFFNNEMQGSWLIFGIAMLFCIPLSLLVGIDTPACRVISLVSASIVSACMHASNFLLISCVPGRFKHIGRSSTVSGIVNACTYIGAAASMYTIALISDALGWSATVCFWFGISLIGAFASILSLKKYTSFLKHTRNK